MLLLAVLEKRGGLRISGCDAYINVIGGLYIGEPAADLAVVLSIASSYKDVVIPDDLAAIGEVGLTGELRSISHLDQRIQEISRHGFSKCIIPLQRRSKITVPPGLEIIQVKNIVEAMNALNIKK